MKIQSQLNLAKANSNTDLAMAKINLNSASEDQIATLTSNTPTHGATKDTTASNVNFLGNHEDSKDTLNDMTTSKVHLNIIDESKSETKSIAEPASTGVTPVALIATFKAQPEKLPIEIHSDAT